MTALLIKEESAEMGKDAVVTILNYSPGSSLEGLGNHEMSQGKSLRAEI
jgi:hypothetical protein